MVDATQGFVADLPDAEVTGGLAERAAYQGIFDVMLLVATVLLAVAVLIALVGVGNTVSLSVLERAREHGLLRALGLRRSQLAAMLGTEAALLALAAAVLGLGLGIGYGFAGTMTVLGRSTDDVVLSVPWGQLLSSWPSPRWPGCWPRCSRPDVPRARRRSWRSAASDRSWSAGVGAERERGLEVVA